MSSADVLMRFDAWGFTLAKQLLIFSWQFILLSIVALIAVYALKNASARIRHTLYMAVFILVPIIPVLAGVGGMLNAPKVELRLIPTYTVPVSYSSDSSTALQQISLRPEKITQKNDHIARYPWAAVATVYALGVAVFLSCILFSRIHLGIQQKRGSAIARRDVREVFSTIQNRLGIKRTVTVIESDEIEAPLTFGTYRPIVLIPVGFVDSLSMTEIRAFATHELAHIRRYDSLILMYVSLVRAVFFFNPAVWFAARQLSLIAEHACDEMVVDTEHAPLDYAEMLVRLARTYSDLESNPELAAGLMFSRHHFFKRVEQIVADKRDRITSLSTRALAGYLSGGIIAVILIAAAPISELRELDIIPINRSEIIEKRFVFRARIIDSETGSPIQGARLYRENSSDTFSVSDRDGYIELPGMKPGVSLFYLAFDRGDIDMWWSEDSVPYTENVVSRLSRSGFDPVAFNVTDKMKPVTILVSPNMSVTGSMYNPNLKTAAGGVSYTDSNVGNSPHLDNREFDLALHIPETTTPAAILVEPRMTVSGTVYDPDGSPVPGATIVPTQTGTGNSISGDLRYSVRADANGKYVLYLPSSGNLKYNLMAHDGVLGESRQWANGVSSPMKSRSGMQINNHDIILTSPASITGIVVDSNGNPLRGHDVYVSCNDGLSVDWFEPNTVTDHNGRFTLTHIRPGDVRIISMPHTDDSSQTLMVAEENVRMVTVSEGQTVDNITLIGQNNLKQQTLRNTGTHMTQSLRGS